MGLYLRISNTLQKSLKLGSRVHSSRSSHYVPSSFLVPFLCNNSDEGQWRQSTSQVTVCENSLELTRTPCVSFFSSRSTRRERNQLQIGAPIWRLNVKVREGWTCTHPNSRVLRYHDSYPSGPRLIFFTLVSLGCVSSLFCVTLESLYILYNLFENDLTRRGPQPYRVKSKLVSTRKEFAVEESLYKRVEGKILTSWDRGKWRNKKGIVKDFTVFRWKNKTNNGQRKWFEIRCPLDTQTTRNKYQHRGRIVYLFM